MVALYRDPQSRLRRGAHPIVWAALLVISGRRDRRGGQVADSRTRRRDRARAQLLRDPHGVRRRSDEPLRMRRLQQRHASCTARSSSIPSAAAGATTYYGEGSGVDVAIRQSPAAPRRPPLRIGVVGLGAGTMAALGDARRSMRFFEINPAAEVFRATVLHLLSRIRARRWTSARRRPAVDRARAARRLRAPAPTTCWRSTLSRATPFRCIC